MKLLVRKHHAIWPEGRPDAVRRTRSTVVAAWIKFWMGLTWLFPLSQARRIFHFAYVDGDPQPQDIEYILKRRKDLGIPPKA